MAGAVSFKANDFDPRQMGGIIISAEKKYDLFITADCHGKEHVSTQPAIHASLTRQ